MLPAGSGRPPARARHRGRGRPARCRRPTAGSPGHLHAGRQRQQALTYDHLNQLGTALRWLRHRDGPGSSNIAEAGGFVRSRAGRGRTLRHPVPFRARPARRPRAPPPARRRLHRACLPSASAQPRPPAPALGRSDPADRHPRQLPERCRRAGPAADDRGRTAVARDPRRSPRSIAYRGAPVFPERELDTDAEYAEFIRRKAETIYHPVGTCRMGKDDRAVVDSELRVRGIGGLRVVDASVMPSLPTGNTNAPTIMIAERASALILGQAAAQERTLRAMSIVTCRKASRTGRSYSGTGQCRLAQITRSNSASSTLTRSSARIAPGQTLDHQLLGRPDSGDPDHPARARTAPAMPPAAPTIQAPRRETPAASPAARRDGPRLVRAAGRGDDGAHQHHAGATRGSFFNPSTGARRGCRASSNCTRSRRARQYSSRSTLAIGAHQRVERAQQGLQPPIGQLFQRRERQRHQRQAHDRAAAPPVHAPSPARSCCTSSPNASATIRRWRRLQFGLPSTWPAPAPRPAPIPVAARRPSAWPASPAARRAARWKIRRACASRGRHRPAPRRPAPAAWLACTSAPSGPSRSAAPVPRRGRRLGGARASTPRTWPAPPRESRAASAGCAAAAADGWRTAH